MKNVKIKTEKVLAVYNILKDASYQKMTDDDKIKLWKVARLLKPTATKFEDDCNDASKKLKSEGFDERLEKAKDYELKKRQGDTDLPLTEVEYMTFINGEWAKFNRLIADAIKEFADEEVELEFEPLTEEAFACLMSSNNWKMDQAMTVSELIIV